MSILEGHLSYCWNGADQTKREDDSSSLETQFCLTVGPIQALRLSLVQYNRVPLAINTVKLRLLFLSTPLVRTRIPFQKIPG